MASKQQVFFFFFLKPKENSEQHSNSYDKLKLYYHIRKFARVNYYTTFELKEKQIKRFKKKKILSTLKVY